VDTHNNGCKTLHPSLLQIMTFPIEIFDQKVPLLVTSQKNHLNHFVQVVFDITDLIVAFLTSQMVDYLIDQINQQKIWVATFLGQFFNFKNVYPKFSIKCR
jgi:hypothetical protein